jgi:hypothetical protein
LLIEEVSKYSWLFTVSVSVLFVVVGWVVVYWNACKLATRTETKSLLDKAISQLEALTVMATDFWLGSRKDRLDEDHFQLLFMAQLSRLGLTIDTLNNRGLSISFDLLSELSANCTLQCENANTLDKKACHLRGHQINETSMQLTLHFLEQFQAKYKPIGL